MAKVRSCTILKEVVTLEQAPGYTLELTAEEASTLVTVLSNIGGCPETSPRRYVKAILDGLVLAKVPRLGSFEKGTGAPYFESFTD